MLLSLRLVPFLNVLAVSNCTAAVVNILFVLTEGLNEDIHSNFEFKRKRASIR